MNKQIHISKNLIYPLNNLIPKEGIEEYIRDYYASINGYLKILYSTDDFYIAEDTTYQPWISIMGNFPKDLTKQGLYDMIAPYITDNKYIAAYTNNKQVSEMLSSFDIFTYHEDFLVGCMTSVSHIDGSI